MSDEEFAELEASLIAQLKIILDQRKEIREICDRIDGLTARAERLSRMPVDQPSYPRVQPQFRLYEPRGLTWSSG